MFRLTKFKKIFRKSISIFFIFQLSFFQLFSFAIPQLVSAQSQQSKLAVSYNTAAHSLNLSLSQSNESEYGVYYQAEQLEAVRGSFSTEKSVFLGTCSSGNDCVEHLANRFLVKANIDDEVQAQRLELNNDLLSVVDSYQSNSLELDEDEQSWLKNEADSYTIDKVELNQTYTAREDERVSVTFTKLPEDAGSLTIKQLQLSKEQVAELGALSDLAYEITSNMADGSFEYDLTLPNPQPEQESQIKYSEDGDRFEDAVGEVKENDFIKIAGLNHFTVFVVTSSVPATASNFIDNGFGAPAFTTDVAWNADGSHGFDDGTHNYMQNDVAGHWARWTFSDDQLPKSGVNYKIYLHWTVYHNHTNVTYKLYKDDGTLKATLTTVDQTLDATGANTGDATLSGAYEVLGSFKIKNGWYIQIETDGTTAGNYYSADAVQIITADQPTKVFVDDNWVGTGLGEEVAGADRVFGYNAFATIQEGIDQVADGGTVKVAAGTYTDDIWDSSAGIPAGYRITKSVTLLGAKAGNDPAGSTDRGGESILIRTNGLPYSLYASNITIDGFMFGSSDPNTGGRLIISVKHPFFATLSEDSWRGTLPAAC